MTSWNLRSLPLALHGLMLLMVVVVAAIIAAVGILRRPQIYCKLQAKPVLQRQEGASRAAVRSTDEIELVYRIKLPARNECLIKFHIQIFTYM